MVLCSKHLKEHQWLWLLIGFPMSNYKFHFTFWPPESFYIVNWEKPSIEFKKVTLARKPKTFRFISGSRWLLHIQIRFMVISWHSRNNFIFRVLVFFDNGNLVSLTPSAGRPVFDSDYFCLQQLREEIARTGPDGGRRSCLGLAAVECN